MAQYLSEFTKFLNEIKKKDPEIEHGQQVGRALLWDKAPISLDEQQRSKLAKVAQKPYVYANE